MIHHWLFRLGTRCPVWIIHSFLLVGISYRHSRHLKEFSCLKPKRHTQHRTCPLWYIAPPSLWSHRSTSDSSYREPINPSPVTVTGCRVRRIRSAAAGFSNTFIKYKVFVQMASCRLARLFGNILQLTSLWLIVLEHASAGTSAWFKQLDWWNGFVPPPTRCEANHLVGASAAWNWFQCNSNRSHP